MIITMPEKMSQEKVNVLRALGAEIIRTPTEAAFDSPESHISVAQRLNEQIPNSHILDQYANPSNPMAHYCETAVEIAESCGDKLDYFVAGAGTGGTISGTARRLKEVYPDITVVGVDPKGSILAEPASLNAEGLEEGYAVEGIGYDFIPIVLDRSIIDVWVKSADPESFDMARRLIRDEGLLCGGSSGTAVAAAIAYAKKHKLGADKRMVVILPDSVRNYMTKFLSDDWMWRNGFTAVKDSIGAVKEADEKWWSHKTVSNLELKTPFTVDPSITCSEAVDILVGEGFDQLPVVDESGAILGMVTEGNLTAKLGSGRVNGSDSVTKALYRQFCKVNLSTPLRELAHIFDHDHFAMVVTSQKCFSKAGGASERHVVTGVVSRCVMRHQHYF